MANQVLRDVIFRWTRDR